MDWDDSTKVLINSLIANFKDFDVKDIPKILPKLITHFEKIKMLEAEDKKNLIVKILKEIVDRTDGPGDDAVWDPIIKSMIPEMIDLLLDVNDGKLKLRKKCWLKCCRK